MSVVINLGSSSNTYTISTVDTLTSGSGDDSVTFTGALPKASIDLGGGNDSVTLANATNNATIANVETITGGTGDDAITLGNAVTKGSIDLGTGSVRSPSPTAPTVPPSAMSAPSPAVPATTPSR